MMTPVDTERDTVGVHHLIISDAELTDLERAYGVLAKLVDLMAIFGVGDATAATANERALQTLHTIVRYRWRVSAPVRIGEAE